MPFTGSELTAWILPRSLELSYTSHDLDPLVRDCGDDGPPFLWDDDRRFEIRCELDAAFFHLYLPADNDGHWRPAEAETAKQLETLKTHFPTPRHAVGFILDQFPLVRQKTKRPTAATGPRSGSSKSTTPCWPPSAPASLTSQPSSRRRARVHEPQRRR